MTALNPVKITTPAIAIPVLDTTLAPGRKTVRGLAAVVANTADSWEAEACRIQARNVAAGFLPIKPARPPLAFERSYFEDKPYPEKVTAPLEERLAALPPEKMNIREAVADFSARTGRKPADADEVRKIGREAGVHEYNYYGLYRDFEHEGYLSIVKNGRSVI